MKYEVPGMFRSIAIAVAELTKPAPDVIDAVSRVKDGIHRCREAAVPSIADRGDRAEEALARAAFGGGAVRPGDG